MKYLVLVEDSPTHTLLFKKYFEQSGLQIAPHFFNDYFELIKSEVHFENSLFIIDIDLPKINGFEVIQNLREKYQNSLFIIFSVLAKTDVLFAIGELRIIEVITKPNYSQLLECIGQVMNQKVYFKKIITFTNIEKKLLEIICDTSDENLISDQLCVSVSTYYRLRKNLALKLNINNKTSELVKYSILRHKTKKGD